jgi:hypothetical protein
VTSGSSIDAPPWNSLTVCRTSIFIFRIS